MPRLLACSSVAGGLSASRVSLTAYSCKDSHGLNGLYRSTEFPFYPKGHLCVICEAVTFAALLLIRNYARTSLKLTLPTKNLSLLT